VADNTFRNGSYGLQVDLWGMASHGQSGGSIPIFDLGERVSCCTRRTSDEILVVATSVQWNTNGLPNVANRY